MALFADDTPPAPEETANQTTTHSAPIPTYNDPELVKWRLTYNDIINQLIFNLRGLELVETPDGQVKADRVAEPKMNEEGIKAIQSFLTSKLTKIAASTYLTQAEINMIMKDAHEQLAYLFLRNHEKWQVKEDEIDLIMYEILDILYLLLKKSYEDRERKYMAQTETITTIVQNQNQPTRKWNIFKR